MPTRLAVLSVALLLIGCSSAGLNPESGPAWLSSEITAQGDFIYAVGRSRDKPSEQEAKDAALVDAVERFVRYCRVDVDTFDRLEESYSSTGGEKTSIESKSLVRAKAFVARAVPEKWHLSGSGRKRSAAVLLKVPKSEFDRISSQKDVRLSLDIALYHEDKVGVMQPMDEGAVLQSADGYALFIQPSDTCFLYIYQIDALGKSSRVFPNPAFRTAANPVAAGAGLWVPNEKDVLLLDETTGKERLYVLGSLERVPELEGAAALEGKDLDAVVAIKKMGVAAVREKLSPGQVPAPRKAAAIVEVKRKLQAQGQFVYETWFWHR